MLFNSFQFLIFFPIVVLIYFFVPQKMKNIWLLITSYYFYMSWDAKYIFLILFVTAVSYIGGIAMDKTNGKQKKIILAVGIIITFSVLFFFKYFNLAIGYLNYALNFLHIKVIENSFNYALPVGISFFTFQAVGYMIDVYRGNVPAERNGLQYALFIAFFPQLVAGPIERSENLLRQVKMMHSFDYEKVKNGLFLMLWGFFLKLVIADRAAIIVNTVYGDYGTYGGCYIIVATILFAFQIYCDFCGYSTIARGAAMVMGFELMENFKSPYLAKNVADFWRRWHISLSGWFKDYMYIPMGGNRKGKIRKYVNLLVVFATSGLWHGASMSYVVWGALNGLYQIVGDVTKPIRKKLRGNRQSIGGTVWSGVITFILVDFAWLFFRAESMGSAVEILKSMTENYNPWIFFDGSLYELGLGQNSFWVMIWAIALLMIVDVFHYKNIHLYSILQRQGVFFKSFFVTLLLYAIIMLGVYGVDYDTSTFIYFAF